MKIVQPINAAISKLLTLLSCLGFDKLRKSPSARLGSSRGAEAACKARALLALAKNALLRASKVQMDCRTCACLGKLKGASGGRSNSWPLILPRQRSAAPVAEKGIMKPD